MSSSLYKVILSNRQVEAEVQFALTSQAPGAASPLEGTAFSSLPEGQGGLTLALLHPLSATGAQQPPRRLTGQGSVGVSLNERKEAASLQTSRKWEFGGRFLI